MERVRTNRVRLKQGNIFTRHIIEHKAIYILVFALFVIGFIIGSINAAFVGENVKTESQNYILDFVESLKTQEIDNKILLKESITANIKPIIYVMLFGLVIIGIPFIFIYMGLYSYSIGFTITTIISTLGIKSGIALIFTLMIPQQIVLVPALIIISTNAILFSKTILNIRKVNLRAEVLKYVLVFLVGVLLALGISMFETYIGSSLIKAVVKII